MMRERKSLADLVSDLPRVATNLVRAEVANLKDEVTGKAKKLGAGSGMLAAAGVFALFMLGWLLVAGFEGFKLVVEPWAAALLVAAGLLIVTVILGLAGFVSVRKGADFNDLQSVDSIKDDVNVVRGLGHAADGTSPLSDLPTATNGDRR